MLDSSDDLLLRFFLAFFSFLLRFDLTSFSFDSELDDDEVLDKRGFVFFDKDTADFLWDGETRVVDLEDAVLLSTFSEL